MLDEKKEQQHTRRENPHVHTYTPVRIEGSFVGKHILTVDQFARDDLLDRALCILTATKNTSRRALETLKRFWLSLGCTVRLLSPQQHDRIFADVSHLPHITAAALVNVSDSEELRFAGKGFMDTSRIASGPANIWADVLLTNAANCAKGIDRVTRELARLKKAIRSGDRKRIEKLLESAKNKRSKLVEYKMSRKELI